MWELFLNFKLHQIEDRATDFHFLAVQPPQFLKKLPGHHLRTDPDIPLSLECLAEGAPLPTYDWYKDGVVISDSSQSLGFEFNFNKSRLVTVIFNHFNSSFFHH